MGASMEVAKFTERLVPSTRFVAVDGISPQMAPGVVFVAPSASIIGDRLYVKAFQPSLISHASHLYYSLLLRYEKTQVFGMGQQFEVMSTKL
jgi:hypothetical protein